MPAFVAPSGSAMHKLLLMTCCLLACAGAVAKPRGPIALGTLSPDDLGHTVAGQHVTASSLRGKVVVISFWATWCGYCMQELPVLGNLQIAADQHGLPLQVVEVNFEQDHRVFVAASHLLTPKLPGLLLTWDRNGSLAQAFGLGAGLPAMVILHRNGTIADIEVGYDKSELDPLVKEINQLMNEPAPPLAAATPAASTK